MTGWGYWRRSRYHALAKLATSPGTITNVTRSSDGKGASMIAYRNADGIEVVTTASLPGKRSVEGATVTVAFNPTDPNGRTVVQEAAEDLTTPWIVGGVFVLLGLVMSAVVALDLARVAAP